MKFNLPFSRVTKYIAPVILIMPLLLAVYGLQNPAPLLDLFVNGGTRILFYNLCVLLLIPYFILFVLALGDLYLSRFANEDMYPLKRADLGLISFFAGAGFLTILGFILGLLELLYFWICFPVFVFVIYIYLLRQASKQFAGDLWNWISANKYEGGSRYALILLRAILIAVIAAILLSKGILLELFKDGGLHQYFGYFAETRLSHSTWMDPSHPILYDYLASRGQGAYLFLTSFTNQFTIQIISVIYLIVIGGVSRQVIDFLLCAAGKTEDKTSLRNFLPDLVMLLVITSRLLEMEPARFHLQTGAFFMFLAWTSPMFFLLDQKRARWLFLSQIPVIIAFPIISGVFYGFIVWVLGLLIVSLLLIRKRDLSNYPLLSLVIGAASCIASFSLNWLYVGIPDLQPSQIFLPLMRMDRFQQWSSLELVFYLKSSLNESVSISGSSIGKIISNTLGLFSYPVSVYSGEFPAALGFIYSIVMLALLLGKIVKYFLQTKAQEILVGPINIFWVYGLTFFSSYFIKVLATAIVNQESINRMLLFTDAYPVITFFAIIILLTHRIDIPMYQRQKQV